jgi:hypothetical protein
MRRHVVPVAVALLVLAAVAPVAGQRAPLPPAPMLDEPRPMPLFPALVVPFTIPAEYCRGGKLPGVQLRIFNSLTQPTATLVLRDRRAQPLDGRPLRCGEFVARWDGTLGTPIRLAEPSAWYLQLAVDTAVGRQPAIPPILRTRKFVIPAF